MEKEKIKEAEDFLDNAKKIQENPGEKRQNIILNVQNRI